MEPFLTRAVSDEMKEEIGDLLGKSLPKDLDFVPLTMGDRAVITGNSVKGKIRHIISAQLTEAGIEVCIQETKLEIPEGLKSREEREAYIEQKSRELGRLKWCKATNPCFVCTWFGTVSRQGALYFSMLKSVKPINDILTGEPIPMVALTEDAKAQRRGSFALIAPVKESIEFQGWIGGENLSDEILGAFKEVQDMSQKGFIQFGGLKTRGFGAIRLEIFKVERYKAAPFELENSYEGYELLRFLENCQQKYHELLRGGSQV